MQGQCSVECEGRQSWGRALKRKCWGCEGGESGHWGKYRGDCVVLNGGEVLRVCGGVRVGAA